MNKIHFADLRTLDWSSTGCPLQITTLQTITKTPNKFILSTTFGCCDCARANGQLILISITNGYIVFIFSSIGKMALNLDGKTRKNKCAKYLEMIYHHLNMHDMFAFCLWFFRFVWNENEQFRFCQCKFDMAGKKTVHQVIAYMDQFWFWILLFWKKGQRRQDNDYTHGRRRQKLHIISIFNFNLFSA